MQLFEKLDEQGNGFIPRFRQCLPVLVCYQAQYLLPGVFRLPFEVVFEHISGTGTHCRMPILKPFYEGTNGLGTPDSAENLNGPEPCHPVLIVQRVHDVLQPVVIKVKASEPVPFTRSFMEASQENMKTCKLNAEGLLEGYNGVGVPFLEPKEPEKGMKIMWNQFYKELPDDWTIPVSYLSISKRKGGRVSISDNTYEQLMYAGRHCIDPMPELNNPKELFYANKSTKKSSERC